METKICKRCKNTKTVDAFYKTGKRFSTCCKECSSIKCREWRLKNKDRHARNNKLWQQNNKEKCRVNTSRWKKANYEKVLEKNREYEKTAFRKLRKAERGKIYNLGIKTTLNKRISRGISKSIGDNKNHRKWEDLVGYTVDQLKRHLEKQFDENMSWDNRRLWHIDHIIPISAFNFEKPEDADFKKCWNLKNLRPLWSIDNLKKGKKLSKPLQQGLIFK